MPSLVFSSALEKLAETFTTGWSEFSLSGGVLCSLIIMSIVAILAIVIGIQAKVCDPLKPAKGPLMAAEMFVEWLEQWVKDNMGLKHDSNWGGYFMALFTYLFMSFIWGITGMHSVIDVLLIPLSLAVVMFILIQATALRYQKVRYFHRYIEPFVFWLPINPITMWSPIISTSLRMFGNCIAGSIIISIVDWALQGVSMAIFSAMGDWGRIFLSPIPIAVLNLYFSLFSGFVQTLVFCSLNAAWIGQEIPRDEEMGTSSQLLREPENKALAQ
ncbi:MAG: F0F1 ATP synthase subunit A [Bacilli bacterium]|nr:F0F1 ATP synthase subunit A [Bacilli bacterium]